MGQRIAYRVKDSENNVYATLFSNHHHDIEPLQLARTEAPTLFGPTTLTGHLLTRAWPSDHGGHRAGDQVFWLIGADLKGEDIESVCDLHVRNGRIVASPLRPLSQEVAHG